MPDGLMQYQAIVKRLAEKLDPGPRMSGYIELLLEKRIEITKDNIGRFLEHLARISTPKTLEHQDVFRAFLLLNGGDLEVASTGYSWLQGMEIGQAAKEEYGFLAAAKKPSEIVRGLSWIMGLTGPTMIAVDQIDAIVSAYNLQAGVSPEVENDKERRARAIIEGLAVGLMELHDVKGRAQVVVACIEGTWAIIKEKSLKSATQRFREATFLKPIARKEISEVVIGNRLAPAYREQDYSPPYATWPFRQEAFAGAVSVNPRQLLMRCEEHRKECLASGEAVELSSFAKAIAPLQQSVDLNPVYEQTKAAIDLGGFLDHESGYCCHFLFDVLRIYVRQSTMSDDIDLLVDGDLDQKRPPLHGRLRFIHHSESDREEHYSFRFINHDNATAFQTRLKAAVTASGIDRDLPFRRLFVLRNSPLPSGKGTERQVSEFEAAGGRFINLGDDDLRSLIALQQLMHQDPGGFDLWLQAHRPLCNTNLFKQAGLCEGG